MAEILLKDEVYAVVGAAMEVYNVLGPGFLEAVYQEAMEVELAARGIPFEAQKTLPVFFKGKRLRKEYVADLLCFGVLIGEIKAMHELTDREEAQLLNYLSATKLRVGILLNFGHHGGLEWERRVL